MKNLLIVGIKKVMLPKGTLIIIDTPEGAVVRREDQFMVDCSSSGVSPNVAILTMKGGFIQGDIQFIKKGDKYILQEYNTKVKNNQGVVGEEAIAEKDSSRVEGFLSLSAPVSSLEVLAGIAAKQDAERAHALLMMKNHTVSASGTDSSDLIDDEDLGNQNQEAPDVTKLPETDAESASLSKGTAKPKA